MSKTTAEKLPIKPDTTVWVTPSDGTTLVCKLPAGVATATLTGATTAVLFAADPGPRWCALALRWCGPSSAWASSWSR